MRRGGGLRTPAGPHDRMQPPVRPTVAKNGRVSFEARDRRPGWLDTTAVPASATSPLLTALLVGLLAPACYALYVGAELLAVLSLVCLQLSGLLFAPGAVLSEGVVAEFEQWWLGSRLRRAQEASNLLGRRFAASAARVSLAVAVASALLLGASIWFGIPPLAWIGATGVAYTVITTPAALLIAGFLSGRLLPTTLRDHPDDPPALLSAGAARIFSDEARPVTMLFALALFMLGGALAMLASAPGNAPF